jgi:hypothetical protein
MTEHLNVARADAGIAGKPLPILHRRRRRHLLPTQKRVIICALYRADV